VSKSPCRWRFTAPRCVRPPGPRSTRFDAHSVGANRLLESAACRPQHLTAYRMLEAQRHEIVAIGASPSACGQSPWPGQDGGFNRVGWACAFPATSVVRHCLTLYRCPKSRVGACCGLIYLPRTCSLSSYSGQPHGHPSDKCRRFAGCYRSATGHSALLFRHYAPI